jgi:phytol kinase
MAYNLSMTLAFIVTILAVLMVLIGSEVFWRRRHVHDEFSRKFVHITVGSFVAFWPFFLSWNQIKLLSLAFFVVIVISKYLNVFRAIHSVQRPTWGELFFALAVGAIAFVTHDKWIYMVALLQMSLADGLAAVIGSRYGKRQRYLVFGHAKSVVGTLTFFVVSVLILTAYYIHIHSMGVPKILVISAAAALLENLSVQGLDNLMVPLLAALILTA